MYKQIPAKPLKTGTRMSKTPNRTSSKASLNANPKAYALKSTFTNSEAPEPSKSLIMSAMDKSFAHDEETAALLETIEKLAEHQQLCSKTYQFKEANEAKDKIKELKKEVVMRKFQAVEQRHREEIQQIIDAQEEELQRFNEFWDVKINQYDQEATNVQQQVIGKHGEDIETAKQDLNENINLKLVKTAEQLQMIKIVDSLAQNEEYTEAEKLYKLYSNLEKQGLDKAKVEKEKKIKTAINQLDSKQKLELNSLRQKIVSGKDKMIKLKEDEATKLQQKFKNMLQEIEIVQQLEVSKFELTYKTYIPGEKFNFTGKKRSSMSSSPSEASLLNTSASLSNLDKSITAERSKMSESRNLVDILCAKPMSNQKSAPISKHKRVISVQGARLLGH